jgi:hypothetical protein
LCGNEGNEITFRFSLQLAKRGSILLTILDLLDCFLDIKVLNPFKRLNHIIPKK